MNTKQWLISATLLALAFSPAWGEGSRLTDKDKREHLVLSLEQSKVIIRVAVFETLYQETPRSSGPNYGRIYRRGIVVESLRGPLKAGDYIVIDTTFEDYPKGLGDFRQESPRPELRYFLLADEEDIQPPRENFTGIFTALNGAPWIDSPTPVIKDRERYLHEIATIKPATLEMKTEGAGEK